ncbi:MAG: thymidylate synthase [Candidatus Magasanikbacteria bacterium]|uniref:Thymidylate synthase n=1 Tax=Candidatus Magasanikbacteria bacterium CG10_big_fil_rev_8_21_14_0_10_38_6 TaxID=1974647 RepID=A0A2M6P1T5_9BACT|nr:thymidylate synthase [Candidatus Magasanikbacteria bacterium]NCS72011.1 thymidylate synthase [Candidatus Magasanikbacteria bacterium]PIR77692.1 MAG: thymidylate synthase [Candidatus Magasanikbacteria bacterium CG10_big_fil_rev_8_21_14_0_10_38_6]
MKAYLDIVKNILENGQKKHDRTGTGTIAIAGAMFEHDMKQGFPLLTTKKMPYKIIASELEFFIKGMTDKQWLIDQKNHIWDEWCNPKKVPYAHDEETKKRMMAERDLGPVYGFQWRHYNGEYKNFDSDYSNQGVDQLKKVVDTLKTNPHDRRMIVCAWNPSMLDQMALPPCHFVWQVTVINGHLNLMWMQRSVDVMLGLPFNIASYATLLHLLAKEAGLQEGRLIGFLGDVHIYANHMDGAKEQLNRDPNTYKLPQLVTEQFTNIFDWKYSDSTIQNYKSHPRIHFDIAI